VRHHLRDPTFSHFDTILECDRQTDRHTTTAYTALSIARGYAIAEELRDRLSVEILQLQNIAIVWHYLRDLTLSRFYTIPKYDRHTHGQMDGQIHDDGVYCA